MARSPEDRLRSLDLRYVPPSRTRALSDGIRLIGDRTVSLAAYELLEIREQEWLRRNAVTNALVSAFRNAEDSPVPAKFSPSIASGLFGPKQPFVFFHGSWDNRTRVGVLTQFPNSIFQEETTASMLRRVVEGTLKISPQQGDPGNRTGDLLNVLRDIAGRPAKGKSPSILIGYGVGTPFVCATFNPETAEAGLLPTGVLDQSRLEKNLFDYWTRVSQRDELFVAVIEIDELCALLNFALIKRLDMSFSSSSQSEVPFGRVINPYFISEVFSAQAPLEYLNAARRDKSVHPVIELPLSRLKINSGKPRARQLRV